MKLHLALKAEYYDAIRAGTKPEEYRLANDYWTKRLYEAGLRHGSAPFPRVFNSVVLTKGYPKAGDTERTIVLPWRGFVRKTITHPHFGPDPVEVFAIVVGTPPSTRALSPEPCVKGRCYSPIACEGWGYCRERNLTSDPMDKDGIRPADLIVARRAAAQEAADERP